MKIEIKVIIAGCFNKQRTNTPKCFLFPISGRNSKNLLKAGFYGRVNSKNYKLVPNKRFNFNFLFKPLKNPSITPIQ